MKKHYSFYEFFAGAGMVRAGLGENWECKFANDIDGKKGLTYQDNWGVGGELFVGDICSIGAPTLPGTPDLMWGSFPCQDLSLAGKGAGLNGERSGTFFSFWGILNDLKVDKREPKIVAIENVLGTLHSKKGQDFENICSAFASTGYAFGALTIDAKHFLPQSRPRLFVIGIREKDVSRVGSLLSEVPTLNFHSQSLQKRCAEIPKRTKEKLIWWNLPSPPRRVSVLSDILEDFPSDVDWHSAEETDKLLRQMSPANIAKVQAATRAKRTVVGTIYKRTRTENGERKVRAEVRFDDVAGCLRTPNGGSSRQTIMVVEGNLIKSRLISARETARLMGLPDSYKLPKKYNEAYHLTGDGVAVPVVNFLSKSLFEPILQKIGEHSDTTEDKKCELKIGGRF